jgi:hypothetical protein
MFHSFRKSMQLRAVTNAAATLALLMTLSGAVALAQSPQMEQKLMAIKEKMAMNKQQLAQYSWQQTETISIKGEVKDTKVYRVQMGPSGQQKTLISNEKAQSGGREGMLKKHVAEKKGQEYQEYGQQIAALAKEYTTPEPGRLMQAKQQGNVSLQVGGNGTASLVIKNFVKPNDQVTFTINEQTKQPISARIQTYLNEPSDVVTISADFAQLPDGTNHVVSTTINGESKHLTVVDQNSNYQKTL